MEIVSSHDSWDWLSVCIYDVKGSAEEVGTESKEEAVCNRTKNKMNNGKASLISILNWFICAIYDVKYYMDLFDDILVAIYHCNKDSN